MKIFLSLRHCAASIAVTLLISSCGGGGDVMMARSVAAIQELKTIGAAQTNYRVEHGQYATSLAALGSLIPASLASGEIGGYRFTLQGSQSGFVATAVPTVPGSSNDRSFYMDETSVIRQSSGPEPATALSPEFGK